MTPGELTLQMVKGEIIGVADHLASLFEDEIAARLKITILIRDPENDGMEILVTSEEKVDDILPALERSKGREDV